MATHGLIKEFKGDNFFLSNFYENPFQWRKVIFPTGEHAFQFAKTYYATSVAESERHQQAICDATTPAKAKYAGRSVSIDVAEWDSNKVQLMREIVHARFLTSEQSMVGWLLNTGAKMLVEGNTWGDTFWGRCDGKGFNTLGVILMEERGYWLRSDFS